MFKSNRIFAATVMSVLMLTSASCTSDEIINDNQQETLPEVTPINTSFKFLSINYTSSYGDPASLSHVAHDGNVTSDIYYEANSEELPSRLNEISRVDDKFFFVSSGLDKNWYSGSQIQIVDTTSFKVERTVDLSYDRLQDEFSLHTCVPVGDNNYFLAGYLSNDQAVYNAALVSLDDDTVIEKFRFDFSISWIKRFGDKLIVAGPKVNLISSKIVVFDIDNITPEGMRVIADDASMFGGKPTILTDSKGMIWAAVHGNSGSSVLCINPETEQIEKKVTLPYSVTSLANIGIAIDSKAENLYFRVGKGFYQIDTEKCETPEDIIYEVPQTVVNGGMHCEDLKMSHDGKLLFINAVYTQGVESEVYELDPETWEVTNIYTTGIGSYVIYVAE